MRHVPIVLLLCLLTSCGSDKGSEKDPLKHILPAEDATWVKHGCEGELNKRKVQGLCAVVLLAKDLKPASPREMLKEAVRQGSTQLVEKAANMLKGIIDSCTQKCGNLPRLPKPQEVPGRIMSHAAKGLKATDLSLARDGDAYVMLVLEGGDITGAIKSDHELDKEAKEHMIDRVKDVLKKQK